MQHVTFDTAKRLKEAGFPQPMPQAGQFLYGANSKELFVILQYSDVDDILTLAGVGHHARMMEKWSWAKGAFVFAPTATDILEQIPTKYVRWNKPKNVWQCGETDYMGPHFCEVHQTNPAEACALAWLKLSTK